jgi:F-type H+-transporting ATPase subunit gamma
MAGAKEIRTKIKSVQNTAKITKAMEMVAASKMRRAQDRMLATRPYAEKIKQVVGHLGNSHPEYKHPFLIDRPIRKVGLIVITTDRGLCGGLNINLFKRALNELETWEKHSIKFQAVTIGGKGLSFFKRLGADIIAEVSHLGDSPEITEIIGPVQALLQNYESGEIDAIYLVSNQFVNTMTQQPELTQLVPVEASKDDELKHHWDYIYEPDSKEVLDNLLDRYIESLVYKAVVENVACEMASRMIAMKSATDNAGELIKELQLVYNKERQAAITQEISEIVGGAAAV